MIKINTPTGAPVCYVAAAHVMQVYEETRPNGARSVLVLRGGEYLYSTDSVQDIVFAVEQNEQQPAPPAAAVKPPPAGKHYRD
jgi:hypothetical protein